MLLHSGLVGAAPSQLCVLCRVEHRVGDCWRDGLIPKSFQASLPPCGAAHVVVWVGTEAWSARKLLPHPQPTALRESIGKDEPSLLPRMPQLPSVGTGAAEKWGAGRGAQVWCLEPGQGMLFLDSSSLNSPVPTASGSPKCCA